MTAEQFQELPAVDFVDGTAAEIGEKILSEQNTGPSTGEQTSDNISRESDSIDMTPEDSGTSVTGDMIREGAVNAVEGAVRSMDSKLHGHLQNYFDREITDKDRERAKETLADQLSDFVDPETRKTVLGLESALIDGDLKAFSEGLKNLKPEERQKFIDGLNEQFDQAEIFGGIELAMDGSGNVLVYEENGHTAVSINPETGEASVKPIEVQPDGSVVLKPGEVINRTADDVMQSVADEATRSLTMKGIAKPRPPWGRPLPNIGRAERHEGLKPDGGGRWEPDFLEQLENLPQDNHRPF